MNTSEGPGKRKDSPFYTDHPMKSGLMASFEDGLVSSFCRETLEKDFEKRSMTDQ